MDPRRLFADPFNHYGNFYGTPPYTHVFDDLFSVPRAGDGFFLVSLWDAEPEVIPIPVARSRRDRNPTRSIPIRVDGPDAKPKRKVEAQQRAEPVASRAPPAVADRNPTRSIPIRIDGPDAKPKQKAEAQQRAEPVASRAPPAVAVAGRRAPSRRLLAEETEDAATEPTVVEIAEEAEHNDEIEVKAAAETEVDRGSADGETDAAEESEPASGKPDGSDAEWEIVTEQPAAAPAAAACLEAPRKEPAAQEVTRAADAGAGVVDTGKVMEIVAAL
nr:hypothetical protein SEVIR_4G100100v2 [Setaria viridis]